MKSFAARMVFSMLAMSAVTFAQNEGDPLEKPRAKYRELLAKNTQKLVDEVEKLRLKYLDELKKRMTKAQNAGNLNELLSFQKAHKTVEGTTGLSLPADYPLAKEYTANVAELIEQKQKADQKTTASYVRYLEKKMKEITKAGKLDVAVLFRDEVQKYKGQTIIEKRPDEPVKVAKPVEFEKTTKPDNATTSSESGRDVESDPEPATDLERGKRTASALVCKKLQAKRPPDGLRGGATAFTAPRGNGRSGANGFIVGPSSKGIQTGTCWRFKHSMGGNSYGFQAVHPWKSGHVLVTVLYYPLRGSQITVATNGSWVKGGWKGVADIKLKQYVDTPVWTNTLATGEHEIVSRLGPQGRYILFFDGKPIVSGTVEDAKPLDFTIPKGMRPPHGSSWGEHKFEGVENKLSEGRAALIVAPCDRGPNVCTDIRFGPL